MPTKPTISVYPLNQKFTSGEVVTFKASSVDIDNDKLTYIWRINGVKLGEDTDTIDYAINGGHSVKVDVIASDGMSLSAQGEKIFPVLNSPPVGVIIDGENLNNVYSHGDQITLHATFYRPRWG